MASESDQKTYQQIELPDEFCVRGDETKIRIVNKFTIKPIAHLKLIPGQKKKSYSDYPLTDQYYCFSFEDEIKLQKGVFFCGKDVAEDFIKLINGSTIELFNPFKSESTAGDKRVSTSGGNTTTVFVNKNKKLFINAAQLLMTLWNSADKGQTPLASVLQSAIDDGLSSPPNYVQVLSVNTILGKSKKTLTEYLNEAKVKYPTARFKDFDFSPLNTIVERAKYKKFPPHF
ncbi:hypothetical protein [Yersinia rochesterensis]|uniref:hypothetical protein n=1 Tax=Yersinia rochesterensis TaxID=1604335 RepID=UPI0011A6A04B|nr:hypothetical protein [Yersinia rochesterensis]